MRRTELTTGQSQLRADRIGGQPHHGLVGEVHQHEGEQQPGGAPGTPPPSPRSFRSGGRRGRVPGSGARPAQQQDRRLTAVLLGLHPNTVDNRLARLAELTGLDLGSPRGTALAIAALLLHDTGQGEDGHGSA
ncbi:helix-turn-helix domain-containing protein [Streptomyces sp. NPDC005780]|uniref:helix-turn-helix domain-containing protein n=1 Tax=Streptomyces sp. NPDC005780 TaxID=3364730 RepID=UPI0036ACBB7C